MVPINLVLVRHGESEGNAANKRSRNGDHSDFTKKFKKRHSAMWRLTDKGIVQAKTAGKWIKENIGSVFDRYYVSDYLRAKETAYYLNFPNAKWYVEFYLRERDLGQLDAMSREEKILKHSSEMIRREKDPVLWAPPGGESQVDLCLRDDRVLDTLHRECSDQNVVIVCHGEVMWGFRIKLERISLARYRKLEKSRSPFNKIYNCQVIHYTCRNPETGELSKNYNWMRSVCPSNFSLSKNKWERIKRVKFSNQDLIDEVRQTKRIIAG